jgi:hypothetical protein
MGKAIEGAGEGPPDPRGAHAIAAAPPPLIAAEKLDFEKLRPKLPRHEEPIPAFVVGDSGEYLHGNSPLTLRKQHAQVGSFAENKLPEVLTLALLKGYETSMRNGYP